MRTVLMSKNYILAHEKFHLSNRYESIVTIDSELSLEIINPFSFYVYNTYT